MSIKSEIDRIKEARASISLAIRNKGVSVPATAKIDSLASYVSAIETGGGGGDTFDTCNIVLDIGTFGAFYPDGVRVFYTAYGDGLSAEFVEVSANEQSEIYLTYVICGSAICVYTEVSGVEDSGHTRYSNEAVHFIICPNSPGETVNITFTETS